VCVVSVVCVCVGVGVWVCGIIPKINKNCLRKQHYKPLLVLHKQYVRSAEGTKVINVVMINVNVSSSSSSLYCCYQKKKMAMPWNLKTKE